MSATRIRQSIVGLLLAASAMTPAYAAKAALKEPAGTVTAAERAPGQDEKSTATTLPASDMDSRETREKLNGLLRGYPPELAIVLKLDPTLFSNQTYLATYPQLATFLAAHPEVTHNPRFFLEGVSIRGEYQPESPMFRMWENVLGGLAAFCVFLVVTGTLTWLVKMLIEQRRWSRLSRVQSEIHNKLLDRFASNDDLLAYIQTPAGRRFLESAPIPLGAAPHAIGAPIGRILWSIQAGLVLATAGVGLLFVSGRIAQDVAEPLFAIGAVILSIGVGFVFSAIVSFVISRKLGLWAPALAAGGDDQASRP